jgi:hypothetical protein
VTDTVRRGDARRRDPRRRSRLDRILAPALALVLAGGLAAALRVDGSTPAPLVASSADGEPPPAGEVREASSPELEGLLASDLAARVPAREVPQVDDDEVVETEPLAATGGGGLDGEVVPLDLIVRAMEVDLDGLDDALAGARHVAPATGLDATTPSDPSDPSGVGREVTVLGVTGATFRPLAPEVTAAAGGVWERFSEGNALVTHELAEELGLELGGRLELRSGAHTHEVRIGAFAANGAPAVADVLVPLEVAGELGAATPNTLLVAAGDDPTALGERLVDATGGELDLRRDVAAPVAEERTTPASPSGRIEPFSYTSGTDGRITIHDGWVERNIDRVQLPGMAATSCHRVMIPQLLAAVDELQERGLYDHLDPEQFAGCFVARHIDWDPTRPLSMHAWGLAIDFNARDNPLGATPVMDPRVVEVFERWGFDWGGRWSRPDGMHFELARIVPTG